MAVILGIDGGGSKTQAVVAAPDGTVLGRGLATASNYQSVGAEAALRALDDAVREACERAQTDAQAITAACLGVAGASRPEDQGVFAAWAATRLPAARFRLVNDAQLVLAEGTPHGWGLAVIAGTGSIAYAVDAEGRTNRAGGWGYLLGDEGSGYAIGLAALRCAVAAFDRGVPPTALTQAILAHFGVDDPRGLVQKVYRPPIPAGAVAALALLVEDVASAGDEAARAILRDAAHALAQVAAAAARPLAFQGALPAALAGSVLVHSRFMPAAFTAAAETAGLRLAPLARVADPVLGAVRLALETLGPAG